MASAQCTSSVMFCATFYTNNFKGDITVDVIGGMITVNVVSVSREVLGMFLLVIEIRAVGRGVRWVRF